MVLSVQIVVKTLWARSESQLLGQSVPRSQDTKLPTDFGPYEDANDRVLWQVPRPVIATSWRQTAGSLSCCQEVGWDYQRVSWQAKETTGSRPEVEENQSTRTSALEPSIVAPVAC